MDDLQGDIGTSGEATQDMSPPGICEGYLMKRRKWPLKGWHKVSKAVRYNSILQDDKLRSKKYKN